MEQKITKNEHREVCCKENFSLNQNLSHNLTYSTCALLDYSHLVVVNSISFIKD